MLVHPQRLGGAPRDPSVHGRAARATPTPAGKFGYLRLKTVGRRSGQERAAILGYYEDGSNLVTLAMNGWADAEPAWWLNLHRSPCDAGFS
jgi:hypothetical protein